jgi:hypothetical protein
MFVHERIMNTFLALFSIMMIATLADVIVPLVIL